MPALILYLLKINMALILFYIAYRFALRKLTFYTLNRLFLVGGIIFSSAYPFIDWSGLFKNHQEINEQLIVIVPNWDSVRRAVLPHTALDYWQLPVSIFWIGVSLMTLRLTFQLFSLYRIHRSSSPEVSAGYKIRRLKEDLMPFSFWQTIYLNPSHFQQAELEAILQHEKIHVREWHTLDVLLAEVSVVFYWFNPGVWLMKQAIKENLEFITDRKVLNTGLDSAAYQYSLVRMIFSANHPSLASNFNFISIKKRIMMMNKKQSSQAQVSRYLLIMPMIMVLTLIFSISKAQLENSSLKPVKHGIAIVNEMLTSVGSISSVDKKASKELVSNDGYFTNERLSATTAKADSKNMLTTNVASTTAGKVDTPAKADRIVLNQPLFIVDGILTPNALSVLNPEDIYSMEVIRDRSLVNTIYGNKVGIGIVLISLKEISGTALELVKSGTKTVLINGKIASIGQIDDLTIGQVKEIGLIIDKDALTKFGKKGEDGAFSVYTK